MTEEFNMDAFADASQPTIDMPVTKNELNLLSICVREYRERLRKAREQEAKPYQLALIDQCDLLEKKLISNGISYDSMHSGKH